MRLQRREFLAAGIASAALVGCDGSSSKNVKSASADKYQKWTDRAGIQLYTLRDLMKDSVPKTLEAVSRLGFSEVEVAGYFDKIASEWKNILQGEGLTAPGAHYQLHELEDEAKLDEVIRDADIVGHDYIIVPWLVEDRRKTIDDYSRVAEALNSVGEKCKSAGLQCAYHNHEFEFMELDGQIPYDVLLKDTDPNLVAMELDVCWVTYAGKSAVEYIQNHPGRFPLFHVKDYKGDGILCPLGEGVVPFDEIFAAAGTAGLKHSYFEHDRPADPLGDASTSFAYMKQAGIQIPKL